MKRWWRRILAVAGLATLVAAAAAQEVTGARSGVRLSRPSLRAASLRVGGRFTRNFRGLQAPTRDVALLGQEAFQYSRTYQDRRAAARQMGTPQSLMVAQVGMRRPLGTAGGNPLSWTGYRTGASSIVPGVRTAVPVVPPTLDYQGRRLPSVNAHLYTPRKESSRFQRLFGLAPVSETAAEEPAFEDYAEELSESNARRVTRAEQLGLRNFKQGTVEARDPSTGRYPNCRDCAEKLEQARQQLRLVREMNPESHVPSLLLAHDALERERPSVAAFFLVDAYKRNPELVADAGTAESAGDVHTYFGDAADGGQSSIVMTQMRRYARLGELNPAEPAAWLLSAYCAWQLGDEARAEAAAERVLEIGRAAEDIERYAPMLSLAAALQQ